EYFQFAGIFRCRGTERVLREQICGAGFHGIAAPRTVGDKCGSDVRTPRICAYGDCHKRERRGASGGEVADGEPGAVSEGGAYGARGGCGEDSARRGARSDASVDRGGRVFCGYLAAAETDGLLESAGATICGSEREQVGRIERCPLITAKIKASAGIQM